MESFSDHYEAMCATVKACLPNADMALIDRAVEYANEKHKYQKRKDGSPYIIHPLAVAKIVAEMGLDTDAVLGALLHDCIEDTDASFEDIAKSFGTTAAELVEGVTKLTRANFSSTEQAQMENLRKMFMAMSKDIRVVLIKIADRLHNMRTMQYQTPEKQVKKCRDLRCGVDEMAEDGLLFHNFAVMDDICRRRYGIGKRRDVSDTADTFELVLLAKMFRYRDHVDGFAFVVEFHHRVEYQAVGFAIKVARPQKFRHFGNGFFFYQHRAEHGIFCF